VLITRTNFDPLDDEQWTSIWKGYGGGQTFGNPFSNPEWMDYSAEDEAKFRSTTIELYNTGRMHQPRKFGANPARRREFWLETCLPDSELEHNPAAKDAWDQFQTIAGLTSIKLDKTYS
jgi:hypothetical protein